MCVLSRRQTIRFSIIEQKRVLDPWVKYMRLIFLYHHTGNFPPKTANILCSLYMSKNDNYTNSDLEWRLISQWTQELVASNNTHDNLVFSTIN